MTDQAPMPKPAPGGAFLRLASMLGRGLAGVAVTRMGATWHVSATVDVPSRPAVQGDSTTPDGAADEVLQRFEAMARHHEEGIESLRGTAAMYRALAQAVPL